MKVKLYVNIKPYRVHYPQHTHAMQFFHYHKKIISLWTDLNESQWTNY